MFVREVNLEYNMPICDEAMNILKQNILLARQSKYKCLIVIHGYGSSGKGGKIRDKVRQWLTAQEKNGKIKTIIYGEDFNIFNSKALNLKNKYKELDKFLKVVNHGITIVEL